MKKNRIFYWAALLVFIAVPVLAAEPFGNLFGAVEKVKEYRFGDGVKIKIHYNERSFEANNLKTSFPNEVLEAAVEAYQAIVQIEGFASEGFSLAHPNKNFAFDPEKTINIYLGSVSDDAIFEKEGLNQLSFKDAPCFDTVKLAENEYHPVILLPVNYEEFIRNWEKINPSTLGRRKVAVDLKGTLMHEMLHAIIFYYNKNLNQGVHEGQGLRSKNVDWYVEGLARYFEIFAGARHDFFSQGFKQLLPDKVRFSRGGSNFFMRYPDQPFLELRYENALFWRFVDYRYGMSFIENLSRELRGAEEKDFRLALEKLAGKPIAEFLKEYARAVLLRDFGLKQNAEHLKEIAKTSLLYKKGNFYLKDGYGEEKLLGAVCQTDWVGAWEGLKAHFGENSVAGDNTDISDVSAWATDYYQIELNAQNPEVPWLGIKNNQTETLSELLEAQVLIQTATRPIILRDMGKIKAGQTKGLDLKEILKEERLPGKSIQKIFLLITNPDPKSSAQYELVSKP